MITAVKKLHPLAIMPVYQSAQAAGFDLHACIPDANYIEIPAYGRIAVPTGLAFQIPEGFEGQVRSRSSMAFKEGLVIVNSPGTIDSDYRGEVQLLLYNVGHNPKLVHHGDRLAQMIISPVVQTQLVEVEELEETERGANGIGSTGR